MIEFVISVFKLSNYIIICNCSFIYYIYLFVYLNVVICIWVNNFIF